MIFFNSFTAILYAIHGQVLSLTHVSYIALGYFFDIIFFSLAIGHKMKADLMNRYKTLAKYSVQQLTLESERKKASEILLIQDFNIHAERAKAILEQRTTIGRKLHDDLSSSLITLKYIVSDYENQDMSETEIKQLQEIELEITSIYNDTRNFSHQLSSNIDLGDSVFSYDILTYIEEIKKSFAEIGMLKVNTHFDSKEIEKRLSTAQTQKLYYWLKERFANAIRNTEIDAIWIIIEFSDTKCFANFKCVGVNLGDFSDSSDSLLDLISNKRNNEECLVFDL